MDPSGGGSRSPGTGSPIIPGQDRVSPRAVEEARKLLSHFEKAGERRFELERIIGEGAWGVTFKMKIKDNSGPSLERRKPRRFVIKRSLTEQGQRNIEQEINALQQLRGAMHIAQPFRLEGEQSSRGISYLTGPILLMEWIGNGLIHDLLDRVADWGQPLPNRLLWRLFLCLCRIVTAMAWPLARGGGAPLSIEVLPKPNIGGNRPPKSRLVHGDLNTRNVMIGELEPLEHNLVPVLKLIDFGASRDLPESPNQQPDSAVRANLFNVAQIMLSLIGGNSRGGTASMAVTYQGEEKRVNSYARDLDGLNSSYKAPAAIVAKHQEKMDNLDPDLRSLVVLSLASNINERLDLESLTSAVERNMRERGQDYYKDYKYYGNESNDSVARIAKELMYNAD
ncbi:hypothetical protein AAE478_007931 [Parahypoxylon ruwenzoriense]